MQKTHSRRYHVPRTASQQHLDNQRLRAPRPFRAFRTNDELAFRRAALQIIEEEQSKHHTALARDLRSLLFAVVTWGMAVADPVGWPPLDRMSGGAWSRTVCWAAGIAPKA